MGTWIANLVHKDGPGGGVVVANLASSLLLHSSGKMPSQFLLGRYPFTGEVTLPGSLFAAVGEGPFFDSAGTPLPVMLWQWNDWVIANGQPPHVWAYRGWLYVYDIASISSAVIDKCIKVTKATETTDALLWGVGHNGGLTSFRGSDPLFNSAGVTPAGDGTTYAQNVLPVDKLGRGVWNGPGFTNIAFASLMKDVTTTITDGWYDFSAAANGADSVYAYYAGSLASDASKDFVGYIICDFEPADVGKKVKIQLKRSAGTFVAASSDFTITSATDILVGPLKITQASDGYGAKVIIQRETTDGFVTKVKPKKWLIVQSSYVNQPYIPPATTVTSCAGSTTNGLRWLMDDKVRAALSGTKCTVAALVYMGVGSGELSSGAIANVLSVRNSSSDIIGYNDTGGTKNIAVSSDATNTTSLVGSSLRNEIHLKFVQVNSAGTQFRVGNKRYTSAGVAIDSTPQYSAWATYDGSFNPLTYLIAGYGLTVPQWIKAVQVWKQPQVDFNVIEKWAWRLA